MIKSTVLLTALLSANAFGYCAYDDSACADNESRMYEMEQRQLQLEAEQERYQWEQERAAERQRNIDWQVEQDRQTRDSYQRDSGVDSTLDYWQRDRD